MDSNFIFLVGLIITGTLINLIILLGCLLVLIVINKQYTEAFKDKLQDQRYRTNGKVKK